MKKGRKQIHFYTIETYSVIGGIQSFTRRLIRHIGNYANCNGYNPVYVGLLRDMNAKIPAMPGVVTQTFGQNRLVFFFKALTKSIHRCDIMLIGSINFTLIPFVTKIFNKKIKVVLFVHGDEVWNDRIYRKKKIYDEFLLKSVDCVASVSWYTARVMSKEYAVPLNKFRLLPNAIDVFAAPPDQAPAGKRILAVSRMDAHDGGKNLDKVIQAMAYVSKQEPEAILEVVGDGVLRRPLEDLASRLGVTGCVRFLGRLTDEDLTGAYKRASVFALPSSKEGFGIVYLEAWQFELPVICSKYGAPSEIVSDGEDGFVVDPGNVQELADKIVLLLRDRDLAALMGRRGRKKMLEKYTDQHYGKNVEALISGLENL